MNGISAKDDRLKKQMWKCKSTEVDSQEDIRRKGYKVFEGRKCNQLPYPEVVIVSMPVFFKYFLVNNDR